jgi:hypothetical protein
VRFQDTRGVRADRVLRTFVEHPSARLLREIRISANQVRRYGRDDYQPLIDCLVDMRRPLALRELAVSGIFGSPCGDVSAVWEAFPRITRFDAYGSQLAIGAVVAPNLEDMRLTLMSFDGVTEAIVNAQAPKLRTLVLGYFDANAAATLGPILDGNRFPALHTLCFDSIDEADSLVDVVLESRITKQLTQFSLWKSTLSKQTKTRLLKAFPKALD